MRPVPLALMFLATVASAGEVLRGRFTETFPWRGGHAATTADHGTTVWWDPDAWDVRGDTTFLAVASLGRGFHTDVHRAASPNPADGRVENRDILGGDGSPGIGIMHTDYQGILSARLRNPMLIASGRPGIVSFWAPRFQTGGHWWEIVLTPTDRVAGAEFSSVPSVNEAFDDPLMFGNAGTPGPGHSPPVDSLNFIATGYPDLPCQPDLGWRVRFGVRSTVGGVQRDFVNKRQSIQELMLTDPAEINDLFLWRIEFHPDRVALFADLDRNGSPEPIESFASPVPWPEVYVHFVAVAYQADHHPAPPCFLGQVREFQWRNITVEPVKYAATVAVPKEEGTRNIPRETGWMAFDLRDIQRFGAPVMGAPQPNPAAYDRFESLAYCRGGGFWCGGRQTQTVSLTATVPQRGGTLRRAQLVYDIRSVIDSGTATLSVNGRAVGVLPGPETVAAATGEEWVHRSIDIDPSLIQSGANAIRIDLAGTVQLDRLQLELAYDGTSVMRRRPAGR